MKTYKELRELIMRELVMRNLVMNKLLKNLSLVLLILISANTFSSGEKHEEENVEPQKGPHNGRLLKDGDFVVELAIFEKGVPPEYRVWASVDEKLIAPKDWKLNVELTRLGGRVDKFTFAAQEDFLRSQSEVTEPHSFDVSVTATYKNEKHSWKFPSHEGRIELTAAVAKQSGISTAIAGAGKLQQQLKLYGQVLPDHDQVRELSARFPGMIRSVKAHMGTIVNAGDILATIEANESLRNYNIVSPIKGTVISRHANEGEMTGDHPLFTVVNYQKISVRMPVFAQDAARVQVGQKLRVKSGENLVYTLITSLTPAVDNAPNINARALIDNSNGEWVAGTWVDAAITVAEIPVALMIDNRALQTFRDWQVVFVQVGDTYEIRPLELGQTDGEFTEVLGGLNLGDRYVVDNSYLLKSDLEKSGASHDH
jgi:membrane fusion protein, heavy metal efflux system